jgi:DNA-binding response OmpR family regulator
MRILLVDDDEVLMTTLAESLIQQRYAVDIATDGETAQDFVALFRYDLLVLDILLPDMDGVMLCQQLRSQGVDIPILMLSARDGGHEKAHALDAGADDYVVKPFDLEELCARIRALLRREGHTTTPLLVWGDLQLDPSACEVVYDGQLVHVTPKEYSMLELFLRRPSQVFSLDAIIENLWSFDDPPGEDAVRTHIKGLRQKLKAGGAPKDLVQTVYGLGYRLKPLEAVTPAAQPLRPNLPTLQPSKSDVATAVARAWEQHQGAMHERIAVLEDTAKALSNNQLTYDLQQEGRMNAHKLVGSLGSFGFPEGSRLARELERILQMEAPLQPQIASEIASLVQTLRQEIGQRSPYAVRAETDIADRTKQDAIAPLPLVLIVSAEDSISQQLAVDAKELSMRSAIAPLDQARQQIQQQRPDVILLLSPKSCSSAELNCIADAAHQSPPIPVVVVTDNTDFNTRLAIVQQGADSILRRSTPPRQMLAIAQAALREANAGAKVLILDDDPQVLEFLAITLPSWGFEITTLEHPSQLWETLERVTPDLLVLDVEMPNISGTDVCRVLRADPRWKQLPILFLTVHQDPETRYQAFSAGADDFVNKPVVAADLANRMMNRLRRRSQQHQSS